MRRKRLPPPTTIVGGDAALVSPAAAGTEGPAGGVAPAERAIEPLQNTPPPQTRHEGRLKNATKVTGRDDDGNRHAYTVKQVGRTER